MLCDKDNEKNTHFFPGTPLLFFSFISFPSFEIRRNAFAMPLIHGDGRY